MALPEYRLYPTNRNIRDVVRQMVPQMEMEPEYQRGHVWTIEQRVELIKSWIMGVPVGNLTTNLRANPGWREQMDEDVYHREDGKIYACVDGKQRVETARQWFASELSVPAEWFEPEYVIDDIDGKVNYEGLREDLQRHIGVGWQILVAEARLPSVKVEAELFLLVNGGGTAQEPTVMERARKLASR